MLLAIIINFIKSSCVVNSTERMIFKLQVGTVINNSLPTGIWCEYHLHYDYYFMSNNYLFICWQNIAAGTAVRFEPGDIKTVELVEIAGNR